MSKIVTINQDKLLMLKETMDNGTCSITQNGLCDKIKLYHGTDILSLVAILKTKEVCAEKGSQHGETSGLNWFSLDNGGNFNRGACFSIEVPINDFNALFYKMNSSQVTSKSPSLDVSNYNIIVENFCDFGRDAIIRYYINLINDGEKYPIEKLRDSIFYWWCERTNNEDTYMRVNDYDFGIIISNILGEDIVRKEGFLNESLNEFMVDKNSNVVSRNSIWFILYRGDLLLFDEKNKQLLDDFIYRHQNDFSEFVGEYELKKYKASNNFDNFINWLGSFIPYLLTGWIYDQKKVYIQDNEYYDILNSNELYQLVKTLPHCNFYVGYKEIDKNEILGNKGQNMPKFWYHGTIAEYAYEIIYKGLRPVPDKSLYNIKHDKTIFFTSSFEQAKSYGNYKWHHHRKFLSWSSTPCVLKIDASKIDNSKLVLDYDVYNIHNTDYNDEYYNNRMSELGINYDNMLHTNTVKKYTDPRKFSKVGYRGIIMPDAIVSVIIVDELNGNKEMSRYEFNEYINEVSGLKDINLDNLGIKEEAINEVAPEVDEYEIGDEGSNPQVGGNFYHINEGTSFDSSEIGAVNYSWDFNEEEYQEWLVDAEYENTQEALMEYINYNVEFELEYLDNETYHTCGRDYVDYNALEDMFGEKMQKEILTTCMNDGSGSFETVNLYSDDDVDINDQNSVNDMAMRLLRHGDYYKDCRGFILTNGVVVYTESEHNEICRIPNINDKFDFVRMGNIRVLPQSIDIGAAPTSEQRSVLRKAIASYANEELYLDIRQGKSSIGAKYIRPDWRYVMGEIDRFFSEGITPQGNEFYESKQIVKEEIDNIIKAAKKIQTGGDSLYILINGDIISFKDHSDISKINGMTITKFLELGNIRLGGLGGIELAKKPTAEQIPQLKKHIADFNGSLCLEISKYKNGSMRGDSQCFAYYKNASPNKIINDIFHYFDDGIKPQGNRFYENKKIKSQITENESDNLSDYDKSILYLKISEEQLTKKMAEISNKYGCDIKFFISNANQGVIQADQNDIQKFKTFGVERRNIHEKIKKIQETIKRKEQEKKNLEDWESRKKQLENDYDVISLAIEKYGTTINLSQAGYILPDGRLLSFGINGYRDVDHRAIKGIYKENNIPIWSDEYEYNYVVDFMNHGVIRCDVYSGILDMTQEPTNEQYSVIKAFVRKAVDIDIDFTDNKGNTLHSVSYSNAKPQQVTADIYRYYNEGIKPLGNVQYEEKKNKKIVVSENTFESWFGNSVLKDENGQPLKMYHGTDSEFDTFSKEHIGRTGAYEGYGFNFTPFESRARSYNGKRVIEAYLRVVNPITTKSYNISLRQLAEIIRQLDEGKPYTDTIVAAYEPPKYGEKWDKKYYMRALPTAVRTIYQYNKENEYGDAGLYAEICLNGNADKFKTIETFEKLGYDSAIFYDNDDRINTVIVFEPNQIKLTSNKTFSTTSDVMGENFDFEVDSSEIDLSSFKKKHELVPNIWKPNNELNSRVRLKLLDIADDFWNFVNLTWVKPRGIILTGSICNFNWSQYSDIDLHLIVDFDEIDEKTEFVRDYLDAKKNEWNNEHSGLQIMGYPVELYVQNLGEMPESNGIYDLEENDWVREPNPGDIKSIGLNKFSIKDKAAEIMTIIDDMYNTLASTDDSHVIEQMGDDANYLWRKVKEMRKSSLEKNGEMGNGNVVYKYLRRKGYLDKLWKLSNVVYDKTNSITESKEIVKEFLDKDYNLPLYKYFSWASKASIKEKAEDLIYSCTYVLTKYFEDISGYYDNIDELIYEYDSDNELIYDDDFINRVVDALEQNGLLEQFIDKARYYADSEDLPTWMSVDFKRIIKNEWCIHFGNDAMNIANEGFTGGTDNIDRLAYTGAGQEKHTKGYDFAFTIFDRSVDFNDYGNEAVIFRTSGVEVYHYGDNQNQVIFWGPYAHDFIPIRYSGEQGDWVVEGQNGQILKSGKPSEIADWATDNLPQYRKQIMAGKNGYIPMMGKWNQETNKYERVPYPIYRNESIKKYLTLLKENFINEETVADGSSNGNPYKERWKSEREALKNFISNYGTIMQSKEDNKMGRLYKVFYDRGISQLIGYNYCLCVQWDEINLKPKSVVYIRALDKFTPNIRRNIQYDTRGFDNVRGSYDDLRYRNY